MPQPQCTHSKAGRAGIVCAHNPPHISISPSLSLRPRALTALFARFHATCAAHSARVCSARDMAPSSRSSSTAGCSASTFRSVSPFTVSMSQLVTARTVAQRRLFCSSIRIAISPNSWPFSARGQAGSSHLAQRQGWAIAAQGHAPSTATATSCSRPLSRTTRAVPLWMKYISRPYAPSCTRRSAVTTAAVVLRTHPRSP